ncbi:MAG: DUF3276 family protein [Spirochaetaceae bacterium]|nr:DUF3276 family protein [Spirochaetaceae bacterium]
MGARGELYTTQVVLENRSYFFNVKENRNGDIFLQIVESKTRVGEDYDRRAIIVFSDDMKKFFSGLDSSLSFIEKEKKERAKIASERKAAKALAEGKKIYKKRSTEQNNKTKDVKKTSKVHVVSKRTKTNEETY